MIIRAVLFDFGGVLYKTPDRRWMKKWQGLLGLGKDEVISSIIVSQDESPYVQAIMKGGYRKAKSGSEWGAAGG